MGVDADADPENVANESGIEPRDLTRIRDCSTSVLDDCEDGGRCMRDSSAPKFTSSCVSEVYTPDDIP